MMAFHVIYEGSDILFVKMSHPTVDCEAAVQSASANAKGEVI